ncbi:MAG: DUF547 domain-containing protein [bacterium]
MTRHLSQIFLRILSLCVFSLSTQTMMAAPTADAWTFWAEHKPDNTHQVDHTLWQRFLDQFLAPQPDGVNLLAYDRARDGQGRTLLQTYLQQLTSLDPRDLTRDEQFAYWVNLYNALTVEVVLANPDRKSIRRMGKGLFSFGPWDDPLITLAGEPVTLNDIEHRILRPIWQDPRIHFAVNCASIGCPNLQPQAFRPDNLDTLLDLAQNEYINHSRGVDLQNGALILSSIFDWYQSDFATDTAGLLEYLARFHQRPALLLEADRNRIKYEYDWRLNSVEPG